MIIFELDGTLADCEHRQHFVDVYKNPSYEFVPKNNELDWKEGYYCNLTSTPYFGKPWKPDWKAFYEACDLDKPIDPVISIWNDQISLGAMGNHQIWSARCESVREKTEKWLHQHLLCFEPHQLKMRPIGDNTPDGELKERWLGELWPKLESPTKENMEKVYDRPNVDFVFDSDPESIKMWRRRGIFVFNCCQHEREF